MPPQTDPPAPQEPDLLAEQIGREIRRARDAKGISVSDLHRKTGISRTVIQSYEKGRYKPGAGEIKRLSEALDCSPNRLIFGREDFKHSHPLDRLLGDDGTGRNVMKLVLLLQHTTPEEQLALLNLAVLLLESRMGGRINVVKLIELSESLHDDLGAQPDQLKDALSQIALGPRTQAFALREGISEDELSQWPNSSSPPSTDPQA